MFLTWSSNYQIFKEVLTLNCFFSSKNAISWRSNLLHFEPTGIYFQWFLLRLNGRIASLCVVLRPRSNSGAVLSSTKCLSSSAREAFSSTRWPRSSARVTLSSARWLQSRPEQHFRAPSGSRAWNSSVLEPRLPPSRASCQVLSNSFRRSGLEQEYLCWCI